MDTIKSFSELYIIPRERFQNSVLRIDGAGIEYADYVETYIVGCHLDIYGLSDNDESKWDVIDKIDLGDYSDLTKIGEVVGRLILYEQMQNDDYDPYMVCDDCDADLEYVMATLQEEGAPLSENSLIYYSSIFYIDELEIFEKYRGKGYGSRILEDLQNLLLEIYHVKPDLLAYYPSPLKGKWITEEQKEEDLRISQILIERVAQQITPNEIQKEQGLQKKEVEGVIQFPDVFRATEDDINKVLGRKNSNSVYPEHLKNMQLIKFYEKNGFREVEGNRLWCKSLYDHDD